MGQSWDNYGTHKPILCVIIVIGKFLKLFNSKDEQLCLSFSFINFKLMSQAIHFSTSFDLLYSIRVVGFSSFPTYKRLVSLDVFLIYAKSYWWIVWLIGLKIYNFYRRAVICLSFFVHKMKGVMLIGEG